MNKAPLSWERETSSYTPLAAVTRPFPFTLSFAVLMRCNSSISYCIPTIWVIKTLENVLSYEKELSTTQNAFQATRKWFGVSFNVVGNCIVWNAEASLEVLTKSWSHSPFSASRCARYSFIPINAAQTLLGFILLHHHLLREVLSFPPLQSSQVLLNWAYCAVFKNTQATHCALHRMTL